MCVQIYDARALRVIIASGENTAIQEAIPACYRLVSAVHSIWKPIKLEFDDYIANPKPSGYQALHTGGSWFQNRSNTSLKSAK